MGIKFERAKDEVVELEERNSLIPAGTYNATIFDAELGEFATGPDKPNGGRPSLKLQLVDADGGLGKSRMFVNLGLFSQWAPSAKNPKGSDNFGLFNFLAALLIKDGENMAQANRRVRKEFAEDPNFELPDIEDLLGTPIGVKVTIKGGNNNYSFLPAGTVKATGGGKSTANLDELEEL